MVDFAWSKYPPAGTFVRCVDCPHCPRSVLVRGWLGYFVPSWSGCCDRVRLAVCRTPAILALVAANDRQRVYTTRLLGSLSGGNRWGANGLCCIARGSHWRCKRT